MRMRRRSHSHSHSHSLSNSNINSRSLALLHRYLQLPQPGRSTLIQRAVGRIGTTLRRA